MSVFLPSPTACSLVVDYQQINIDGNIKKQTCQQSAPNRFAILFCCIKNRAANKNDRCSPKCRRNNLVMREGCASFMAHKKGGGDNNPSPYGYQSLRFRVLWQFPCNKHDNGNQKQYQKKYVNANHGWLWNEFCMIEIGVKTAAVRKDGNSLGAIIRMKLHNTYTFCAKINIGDCSILNGFFNLLGADIHKRSFQVKYIIVFPCVQVEPYNVCVSVFFYYWPRFIDV